MPETPLRTQAPPLRSRTLTSGLDHQRPMTRPATYEGTNLLVFWVGKLYIFTPITLQESHLPYRTLKDLQSRKDSDRVRPRSSPCLTSENFYRHGSTNPINTLFASSLSGYTTFVHLPPVSRPHPTPHISSQNPAPRKQLLAIVA